MSSLRFFRLGLKTNPFFHTTLAQWADPGPGTAQARRLREEPWRVLMLSGARGMGKTHMVEWMLARWEQEGRTTAYWHLPEPGTFPLPGPGIEVFALDEAQRALPRDLKALARWAGAAPDHRLLLTTHEDVSGHLAPLDVLREEVEGVGRGDLDAYLERRIREAVIPGREATLVFPEEARVALHECCGGNFLRLVDLAYDVCEHLPGDGVVTPEGVREAAGRVPPPPEHV